MSDDLHHDLSPCASRHGLLDKVSRHIDKQAVAPGDLHILRLAVLVTAVLLLPDVWLLVKGEPALAVLVLVLMHLAIGVVTYNSLVRLAPVRRRRRRAPEA